jgi:hypothetical protein
MRSPEGLKEVAEQTCLIFTRSPSVDVDLLKMIRMRSSRDSLAFDLNYVKVGRRHIPAANSNQPSLTQADEADLPIHVEPEDEVVVKVDAHHAGRLQELSGEQKIL